MSTTEAFTMMRIVMVLVIGAIPGEAGGGHEFS